MKRNTYIIYYLTHCFFLSTGISQIFKMTGKDSYFAAILGTILGLAITYLYSYIIKMKKNRTLNEILDNHKIIGFITRYLFLLTSMLILLYCLIIYKVFVVNFLLTSTPELYITIPFIILAIYLAYKGLDKINKVAFGLLPFCILLSLLAFFGLIGSFDLENFLPVLTMKPNNFLLSTLFFAGLTTFPNILTLELNGDMKGYQKWYLIACGILILMFISINGSFGEKLTNVFRYPEYMVLKQIKIFNIIEKIENFLSLSWIFDLFMTATFSIYSMKELVPAKRNKKVTIIIIVFIIALINQVIAFDAVIELKLYYIVPYLSIILPIIISLPILYLCKKKI